MTTVNDGSSPDSQGLELAVKPLVAAVHQSEVRRTAEECGFSAAQSGFPAALVTVKSQ